MYCDSSGWYRTPLKTFGSKRASTRTPRLRSQTMHDPSADPEMHCPFSRDTFCFSVCAFSGVLLWPCVACFQGGVRI